MSDDVGVHICWARHDDEVRAVVRCPTCKTRRRFAGWFQEWYGITWTCCACGDSFADGYRLLRSNARGWRRKAAADAKALWARSHALPVRPRPSGNPPERTTP